MKVGDLWVIRAWVSTLKSEILNTLNFDYVVFLHLYILIYLDLILVKKYPDSFAQTSQVLTNDVAFG